MAEVTPFLSVSTFNVKWIEFSNQERLEMADQEAPGPHFPEETLRKKKNKTTGHSLGALETSPRSIATKWTPNQEKNHIQNSFYVICICPSPIPPWHMTVCCGGSSPASMVFPCTGRSRAELICSVQPSLGCPKGWFLYHLTQRWSREGGPVQISGRQEPWEAVAGPTCKSCQGDHSGYLGQEIMGRKYKRTSCS